MVPLCVSFVSLYLYQGVLTLSLKRIFLAEFYAYCVEKTCWATAHLRFPLLVCAEILLKNLHIILVSTYPKLSALNCIYSARDSVENNSAVLDA